MPARRNAAPPRRRQAATSTRAAGPERRDFNSIIAARARRAAVVPGLEPAVDPTRVACWRDGSDMLPLGTWVVLLHLLLPEVAAGTHSVGL